MAYYVVNGNGNGFICSNVPVRDHESKSWIVNEGYANYFNGNSILGIDITWEDEPIEIISGGKDEGYIKVENIGDGTELDIIHGIKCLLKEKTRKELVKFMGNEDIKLIPPTESSSIFVLNVPYSFRRFYFRAIIYKDESFNFLGYKEDNLNVPFLLSEHDLPEGCLLDVLDYLLTGIF